MTEWRQVPGYAGLYEVSNDGQMRSLDRIVIRRTDGAAARLTGVVLRTKLVGNGYPACTLSRDCKQEQVYVHRVVAAAFVGPCPEGQQVNHINGQRTDNRADNLEYVTPRQNMQHGADVLGHGHGERNGMARLTTEKVRQIMAMRGHGSHRQIAALFGCSAQVVQTILAGKSWTHITRGAA